MTDTFENTVESPDILRGAKIVKEDPEHHRTVWCYQTAPGFSIYYTRLEAGGRVPMQRYVGQAGVLHMVTGERLVTIGSERILVRAGEVAIIPAYGYTGIEDPQDAVDDGPCAFWTTYILTRPPMELGDIGVRRIVAARRDEGRIIAVRLDDGRVLSAEEAVREADAGRIRDVHAVHPRKSPPYLRVHNASKTVFSLEELPPF